MLRYCSYIPACVLIFLLQVSCNMKETEAFRPVAIAETALSDTASLWHKAMDGIPYGGKTGAIAVFGGFDETSVLSETLLCADMFDNIDGKNVPDGLPDFSGETVMPVFDIANAPYSGYITMMNENFLREAALKGFLGASSDHCSTSIFDSSLSADKPGAKLFIFSSSILAGYGCQDVEYLLSVAGLDTGVLNTVESAVSYLFSRASQLSNIGVCASRDIISSGVYGNVFRDVRNPYTDRHSEKYRPWAEAAEIVCLSPEMTGSAMDMVRKFFDSYMAAEYTTALSGVIMDDLTECAKVDSLNMAADSIMRSPLPEMEVYKKLMAPGFRFLSPAESIVSDSYNWLRANDKFTHIVAWPSAEGYVTAVSSEVGPGNLDGNGMLSDEYKYNRAQESDIETFRVIPASQGCFTEEQMQRMKLLAPEIYNELIYVY